MGEHDALVEGALNALKRSLVQFARPRRRALDSSIHVAKGAGTSETSGSLGDGSPLTSADGRQRDAHDASGVALSSPSATGLAASCNSQQSLDFNDIGLPASQQKYAMVFNDLESADSQTMCQIQVFDGAQSQQSFGLSLSQDFALTSSQDDLYRFGEIW